REDGRAQLVRGVGDELAARPVQAGEAQPHSVEGTREMPDLVLAGVDDRLVEAPGGDALRRLLEAADPAREDPRGAVPDDEHESEHDSARDQEPLARD